MARNGITWDNYVSLAVNNTSVNVGRTTSVIVEARKKNRNISMGFPCHMAHNNASKSTQLFVNVAGNSNVEELLVGIYVYFDYSSKLKIVLLSFVSFVITIAKPSSAVMTPQKKLPSTSPALLGLKQLHRFIDSVLPSLIQFNDSFFSWT